MSSGSLSAITNNRLGAEHVIRLPLGAPVRAGYHPFHLLPITKAGTSWQSGFVLPSHSYHLATSFCIPLSLLPFGNQVLCPQFLLPHGGQV